LWFHTQFADIYQIQWCGSGYLSNQWPKSRNRKLQGLLPFYHPVSTWPAIRILTINRNVMKNIKFFSRSLFGIYMVAVAACTDLSEEPYDTILKDNFFSSKEDVIRATLRTYDHAHSTIADPWYTIQSDASDEQMTPNRQGHWLDGQYYYRLHYHTWTSQDGFANNMWNNSYQGIAQANNSIEDLQTLDVTRFGLTSEEVARFIAELRVFRAWYHMRLFDVYRNIIISTKYADADPRLPQSRPQEIFNFIEQELKEATADLPIKGEVPNYEGRWTKAGAMSLLVRLYLNAEAWTGTAKFEECAAVA